MDMDNMDTIDTSYTNDSMSSEWITTDSVNNSWITNDWITSNWIVKIEPTFDNYTYISYVIFLQFVIYYFIYIVDYIVCKTFGEKARWFQLHFIINMFVCIFCINDIIEIVFDVNKSNYQLTSHVGGSFALQVHFYHTLNFELTEMDKFHHISSVFLCFPPSIVFNRKILSLFYFIGTGLPGGIDYLLLTLVKNNKLHYLKEKNYNSYINTYIRMPGGAICSFLTFNTSINTNNTFQIMRNVSFNDCIYKYCLLRKTRD